MKKPLDGVQISTNLVSKGEIQMYTFCIEEVIGVKEIQT